MQSLIIPFIRSADEDATTKHTGHGKAIPGGGPRTTLLEHHKPEKLLQLLDFNLPINGRGKHGLLSTVEQVLKYSVNTWDQGFLDKLYASTNAVRIHMHRSASTIEAVKVTPSASPPAENPSIGRNYLGIDFGRFKYKCKFLPSWVVSCRLITLHVTSCQPYTKSSNRFMYTKFPQP